jgi:hypothetical protein
MSLDRANAFGRRLGVCVVWLLSVFGGISLVHGFTGEDGMMVSREAASIGLLTGYANEIKEGLPDDIEAEQ